MKTNNSIFLICISIFLSIVSFFLPWYSFVANTGDPLLVGSLLTTSGQNGSLSLAGISIDHWLLILLSIVVSFTLILVVRKIISIPKWVMYLVELFILIFAFVGILIAINYSGSIQIGLILFIIASSITIFSTYKLR